MCQEQGLNDELLSLNRLFAANKSDSWIRQAVLAISAETQQQRQLAIKHWTNAIANEPTLLLLKERKVACLSIIGERRKTLKLAGEILNSRPDNITALLAKSLVLARNDPKRARKSALRVIELDPGDEGAAQIYAFTLAMEGRIFEAVNMFKDLKIGKISDPNVMGIPAIAALVQGKKEVALEQAKLDFEMSNNWVSEMNLSLALGQNGQ